VSLQRALVRLQSPDGVWCLPGDLVEWTGLNWKLEPTDPDELAVWEADHRDDERVSENRRLFGPPVDTIAPTGVWPPVAATAKPSSGWGN